MQFLVERFVPLSSQFEIILASICEKAFKFERTGFFSNLTYGIDHLIQKIVFMSYLISSRTSSHLFLELLVAFVRLTNVLGFCNEPLSLQHSLP